MTPQPITPAFIGPRFPSFYSECAYLDGARGDAADSYTRHGQPEPIGMRWYLAGQMARCNGMPWAVYRCDPIQRGQTPQNETLVSGHLSPGPDRWKERSRTYPGIASAIADQWGTYTQDQDT